MRFHGIILKHFFIQKKEIKMEKENEKISVITLSFNGKKYLKSLFESLRRQTYENFETVMIDNASTDGSADFVKKNFPEVKIVKNKKNIGFAGGNDSALPFCDGKYIALINNDMVADKDWLQRMHGALKENDADVVGSKILFYKPFATLKFRIRTFVPKENNLGEDERKLGCMIASDPKIEGVGYKKTLYGKNTFGEENSEKEAFHWISDGSEIKVPVEFGLEKYILKLKAAVSEFQKSERIEMLIGETVVIDAELSSDFKDFSVNIEENMMKESAHFVINNAGSEYDKKTGTGKDIGIFEDDNGQYDEPREAKSLCGGSMLIKRSVIEKNGFLDRYFFAYYEDTDFCWRMRKARKKLFYEPRAVVYHIHSGTSKEWSPFFRYHVERNRLAMLAKNGRIPDLFREMALFAKNTIKTRDRKIKIINLKAFFDLLIHLPILFLKRWNLIKTG